MSAPVSRAYTMPSVCKLSITTPAYANLGMRDITASTRWMNVALIRVKMLANVSIEWASSNVTARQDLRATGVRLIYRNVLQLLVSMEHDVLMALLILLVIVCLDLLGNIVNMKHMSVIQIRVKMVRIVLILVLGMFARVYQDMMESTVKMTSTNVKVILA